jgi:uncharacterized protein YjbI with pentapeptide repeats
MGQTVIFLFQHPLGDWMPWLLVSAILAVGLGLFSLATYRKKQKVARLRDLTEHDIASDNQREAVLHTYIDRIAELLLQHRLRQSAPNDEARFIARARTLTALPRLDAVRKGSLLHFLYEAHLIDLKTGESIIPLNGADLSGADLREAHLSTIDLSEALLYKARCAQVNLREAKLRKANLSEADLRNAD